MSYQPPFTITPKILSLVVQIIEALADTKLAEVYSSPQLRRENRLKAIIGSLAIEGNTLNLAQVTAVIEGKPVRATMQEIAEVKGAVRAYDALSEYRAHSVDDLLNAHQKMIEEILSEAGRFRSGNVGVFRQ